MGLLEAAQAIRQGDLSSEDLTRALLERIARHENTVQAFQWIDPAQRPGPGAPGRSAIAV